MTSVEIIIPVHNMAGHLTECLATLANEVRPEDRITVVDDRSTDASAEVATHAGVHLLQLANTGGPYLARHTAAAASDRDVLLFIDTRSRALPGLVDAHRRLFTDPATALSCTNVRVIPGQTVAGKIIEASQVFDLSTRINVPGRLDFYPTANLGVRREAYIAVGGFRAVTSGGDVDLCWRIQLEGLGRLAVDEATLMEWIPRTQLRELISQWEKYGRSAALLDALYPMSPMHSVEGRRGLQYLNYAARRAAARPSELPMQLVVKVLDQFRNRSYRQARRAGFDLSSYAPYFDMESGSRRRS